MDEFEARDLSKDIGIIIGALLGVFLAPVFFKFGFIWLHALDPRFPIWIARLAYWRTLLIVIAFRLATSGIFERSGRQKNDD